MGGYLWLPTDTEIGLEAIWQRNAECRVRWAEWNAAEAQNSGYVVHDMAGGLTLRLNGVSPRLFLGEYFAAVAAAQGQAERVVGQFLSWDLPAERRDRLVRRPAGRDTS